MSFSRYVKSLQEGSARGQYMFDLSVKQFCPELLKTYTVPNYFAGDFFQVRFISLLKPGSTQIKSNLIDKVLLN